MAYNMFRKVLRHLEHRGRVLKFLSSEEILDPQRVVNRALYGTDYHPDDVAFKIRSAMSYVGEVLHGEARDELFKAYEQSLMQGFGILEHAWVNGRLHIGCTPPGEHIQCQPRLYNAQMIGSPVSPYPG